MTKSAGDSLIILINGAHAIFRRDIVTKDRKRKEHDSKIYRMKSQLNELLSHPVVARGISMKYPTSGSISIAEDLLNGTGSLKLSFTTQIIVFKMTRTVHESMLGIGKSSAGDAIVAKQSRPPKKRRNKVKKV